MRENLAFFRIRFNEAIQYKIAAISGVVTQIAWGVMYIMLYSTFMQNGNSTGMTVKQMSTYMWLQQAFIMLLNMWRIDDDIIDDIKTGNVSMHLVKPINIYNMWYARIFGSKVSMTLLRSIPIILLTIIPIWGDYGLIIQTNPLILFLAIISIVLSAMLVMSYIMIFISVVLITITDDGIKLMFQLTMEFLSGAVIPIAFMPTWLANFIKFTPFYYMPNISFNIYSGYISDMKQILIGIIMQMFWIIILTIIGKIVIKKRLKKVVIQGG